MSREDENATAGSILNDHNESKRRLVSLQHEANRIAEELRRVADLLRNGPPYSVLPSIGLIQPDRIQELFRDLHDTFERETALAEQLKRLE